jgi:hypothetical protein
MKDAPIYTVIKNLQLGVLESSKPVEVFDHYGTHGLAF